MLLSFDFKFCFYHSLGISPQRSFIQLHTILLIQFFIYSAKSHSNKFRKPNMVLPSVQNSYFSVSTYPHPYRDNFTQISSSAKLSVWKIFVRFYLRFHIKQSLLQKQLLPLILSQKIDIWVSILTPHLNNQYVQVSPFQMLLADQINHSRSYCVIYLSSHKQ